MFIPIVLKELLETVSLFIPQKKNNLSQLLFSYIYVKLPVFMLGCGSSKVTVYSWPARYVNSGGGGGGALA
jgi:hypothetical protein